MVFWLLYTIHLAALAFGCCYTPPNVDHEDIGSAPLLKQIEEDPTVRELETAYCHRCLCIVKPGTSNGYAHCDWTERCIQGYHSYCGFFDNPVAGPRGNFAFHACFVAGPLAYAYLAWPAVVSFWGLAIGKGVCDTTAATTSDDGMYWLTLYPLIASHYLLLSFVVQ
eukprot:gene2941-3517_t